jgi:subtilisin family serine protease
MASSKLDAKLAARVHSERRLAMTAEMPERVRVLVHVTGDLRAVQEAGLWVESEAGSVVTGTIAVQDLERVAALPDVASIGSNKTRNWHLNKSVPAMHGDAARAIPPGFSGKGVIVGIVDSGIDIFHGSFRNPSTGQTRILFLLDTTQRHKIEITGTVTGGMFALQWQPPPPPGAKTPPGQPDLTNPLPVTATSAQVQAALLQKFPTIKAADIEVTGGPLPGTPIVIDFVGIYAPDVYDTGQIESFVPAATAGTVISITRGREFVREEIDLGLSLPIRPYLSRDVVGHGTHVAGIAAGNGSKAGAVEGGFCHGAGRYVGVAPEADLIIVRTTLRDAENKQGVKYIFDKAAQLGKAAVVNMSFGHNTGPHDGTDEIEKALDGMLAGSTKRMIVIAAGNDGAKFDPDARPVRKAGSGVHTRKTVPAHTPQDKPLALPVMIAALPGNNDSADRSPDILDIWYLGPGQLEVDLVAPQGAGSFGRIGLTPDTPADPDLDPDPVTRPVAGHPVTILNADKVPPHNKKNINIVISPRAGGTIATGEWMVRLWETQGTATTFDCWIGVTDPDIHPRFRLNDQVITGTIAPPATGKLPIAVGAYNPDDHQVHETSARGPTTAIPDVGTKPELCAPGIDITSALNRGESSGGSWCECCYDFYTTHEGTSQAAPHVAGVVALMFEMNPNLDHAAIKGHLTSTCDRPDPDPHGSHGDDGYGFGLVNAEKAVKAARPPTVAVPIEPLVLSPAAYYPVAGQARKLLARVTQSPTGQLVAALVSEHVDEVRRLIDTNRRVLVAWHRMHGPVLLRLLLSDLDRDAPLPAQLDGRPVADGLARFLDALAREGSTELRTAVAEHRDLLLGLPGAEFPPAHAKAS